MKVIFKDARHAMGMIGLHKALIPILQDLINDWPGDELVITSINRTPADDAALGASGIHSAGPPWRAIDIGLKALAAGSTATTMTGKAKAAQKKADSIADAINEKWQYDPGRSAMRIAISAKHGTGPHLHLQVHNNTKLRPRRT